MAHLPGRKNIQDPQLFDGQLINQHFAITLLPNPNNIMPRRKRAIVLPRCANNSQSITGPVARGWQQEINRIDFQTINQFSPRAEFRRLAEGQCRGSPAPVCRKVVVLPPLDTAITVITVQDVEAASRVGALGFLVHDARVTWDGDGDGRWVSAGDAVRSGQYGVPGGKEVPGVAGIVAEGIAEVRVILGPIRAGLGFVCC